MPCFFGHDLHIKPHVSSETGFITCKKCNKWWSSESGEPYGNWNGMFQPGGEKGQGTLSKKSLKKCWNIFHYQKHIDRNDYSSLIEILEASDDDGTEFARAALALIKMPSSPLITTTLIEKWLSRISYAHGLRAAAITALTTKYATEELLPALSQFIERHFYRLDSDREVSKNIYQTLQRLAGNGSERARILLMEGVRKADGDAKVMAIDSALTAEWLPELTEALLDVVKDGIHKNRWPYVNATDLYPRGGLGSPERNAVAQALLAIDKHNENDAAKQKYFSLFNIAK